MTNTTWNCANSTNNGSDVTSSDGSVAPVPEEDEGCVEEESVDLIVTDFRKDDIYIKVRKLVLQM